MTRARRRSLRLFLLVLFALAGPAPVELLPGPDGQVAEAQDQRPNKKKNKKKKKSRARRRGRARGQARGGAEARPQRKKQKPKQKRERGPEGSEDAAAAQEAADEADSEIVREGDQEVKVMRFSGLDVEGRLKSPMLLYFTNRVRAEFDRPSLPHRSFMPELQRSTRGEELK